MSITACRTLATLAAAMVSLAPAPANAHSCQATSGPQTTPLVELYTSEGCDSCPPADRWLSAQFPRTAPAGAPIAVAFHVDYWDRLGWVDRFASPRWTARQYDGVRAHKDAFAYTPQFLLQGHDSTAWRRGDARAAIDAAARKPAAAKLELTATVDGTTTRARVVALVPDAARAKKASIAIAYTDSGLVSDVRAGENRGARLTHDHVVRALEKGRDGALAVEASFARPGEAGIAPTIVAFVQDSVSNDVLQAVALPLADCDK